MQVPEKTTVIFLSGSSQISMEIQENSK